MKKVLVFLLVAAAVLFLSVSPLWALDSKRNEDTILTTSFNDDLYVLGSDIIITEDVAGDLVIAGGKIEVVGNITQDLMVGGGMVHITGDVGDDIRISGGIITISGDVGDSLLGAGGQIYIKESSEIGGALALVGDALEISGNVQNDAILKGGEVTISGRIDGDVNVEHVNRLKITSSAEITGDLIYRSTERADISENAVIGGEIKETIVEEVRPYKGRDNRTHWAIFAATGIGGRITEFLGLFVLGIVLLLAISDFFQKFNDRMKSTLGYCVGGGAIVLFGIPIAVIMAFFISILLFITIIGSGLGIVAMIVNAIMLILYGLLVYLSTVFLSYLLGRLVLYKTSLNMDKYGWKILAYLIGLVITMILVSVPFVGWIIRFIGILLGFGGLVLVIKDMILKGCRKK